MKGIERITKALNLEEADRVPLYIHAINEAPIIGIGKHITDGLPDSSKKFEEMNDKEQMKLIDTLFLLHEEFGVDGFTSFDIGQYKDIDSSYVEDHWGVTYKRSDHGIPVPVGHPLSDISKLSGFVPPNPKREHMMLLELGKDRFKGEKALFWMMRGTFVRSWRLTGMENLMIMMYEAPETVHKIAQMTLEFHLKLVDMIAEVGANVIILEDDIASSKSPLISPKHYKEFVFPYNKKIVEYAHSKGLKIVQHSDGNLWPLLDTILDAGFDGLNPLEPQGDMQMKKVKDYCGDKICLLGNIDCMHLLPNGTPEEVDASVKQTIEDGAKGGGLIICSSNTLHPGVNPENCIAMFKAVKKYGRY
ncbi:hypothetical protein KJ966_19675 [bacterium]|nr:hypothetical protein [bacterium]